ncbi:hypothetical protein [Flavobacterium sp. CAN_S2]|uniref:hypothetical protein n=1 Tax=Flavobacterium sp. CAN_S2 TaxID=2787726 RepID=UPI0018CB9586
MRRTDMSKYLIHSVRKSEERDLPNEEHEFNEHNYFPLLCGEKLDNEFDVLKNIIREGGLRANLSFRNGKATIYGNNPVICFTEMPLINFLEYVKLRHNSSRITQYGVAMLKKEVYKNGGRPVISGLSTENFEYLDAQKKILKPEILPLAEQYRYVKFDFTTDWTHEREWRIVCNRDEKNFNLLDDYNLNVFDTYGLNIFSDFYFSEVIIILYSEDEAKEIHEIVQDQLDSNYAKSGQEFYTKIKYLIVQKAIELLEEKQYKSIEDLPNNVFYKHTYETLTEIEIEKVKNALKKCTQLSKQFADEFFELHNLHTEESRLNYDISGFATVTSLHSNNKYYRYLLNEKFANAVDGSIWLKNLSAEIPSLQSLTYQEFITKKQSEFLNEEIENIFYYYSKVD